ncbi:MAG: nuclear transport factor 2 family protein [Sphingomonadales bacterium]|nr:nuclear transport factor 2 family protein [Sphingomonadales bacterium]
MTQPAPHALARAYFAAVEAGDLPDSLLTEDFTAWTTTQGDLGKAQYQAAIRLLARLCREPIRFTIDAITAEADRVVAEARSRAVLIDGSIYENTYVFPMRLRDGRIAWIGEHFNALVVAEKLVPLIDRGED